MEYRVRHRTTYRYLQPVAQSVHLLHLEPRATVRQAAEPVLIAGAAGEVLFCNEACGALIGCANDGLRNLSDLVARAVEPQLLEDAFRALARGQGHWRGELALRGPHDDVVPVAMRAEAIPGRDGRPLGLDAALVLEEAGGRHGRAGWDFDRANGPGRSA